MNLYVEMDSAVSMKTPDIVWGQDRNMGAGESRAKGTAAGQKPPASTQETEMLRLEVQNLLRENQTLKIAVAELERIVDRDTLTPLYNRRYFMHALIKRKARLQRHKQPCALVYIDVDGLKGINDAHGHAAGDFALLRVADLLKNNIRASDIAARLGGDEFALLLDHVDEAAAQEKGQRLNEVISNTQIDFSGRSFGLSASIGCIMITPDENEDQLLARADKEMYRVKQSRG